MTKDIPMVMDNGEPVPTINRPLYGDETFAHPDVFLHKAKKAVAVAHNDSAPGTRLTDDDLYIVWFAKVLGNWKALVSTDVLTGAYWEVTYDGNKHQTYVDQYAKVTNTCLIDEYLEGIES